MLLNKSILNIPIINNTELLKEIIKDSENELYEIYDKKYIYELIDENSDIIYLNESDELISLNESRNTKLELDSDSKYSKFSSDESFSLLTLLKLFDEIISEIMPEINLYNTRFKSKYSKSELYELIDEILSELYSRNILNNYLINHYMNNEIKELKEITEFKSYDLYLDAIKFKFNISDNNLLSNRHLFLNNELIDSEIHELFYNDLSESILSDINSLTFFSFKSDEFSEFLSKIIKIYDNNELNKYEIFESLIIEFLNDEFSLDIKYSYENKPDAFYKNNTEYYLEISLYDLMKLNKFILESYENYDSIFNINDSKHKNIFQLIENVNNSLDSDSFIYGILELFSEYLYSDYYESCYLELYSINSSNYRFKKVNDIYELIEIVLNEFKHYDLRNSFKFNDSCYEVY